ncbi:hypothetical protein EMCRGX_G033425 [Ephydatia muelleri]
MCKEFPLLIEGERRRMAAARTSFILSLAVILTSSMAARLRPHHHHEANHDIHGVYLESPEQVSMRADYQPIRISVHYDNLPADIVQTVKTIMTVATDYFKELLKVRPIQGPLLLDRSCSSTSRYINGIRYCDNSCYQKSSCSGFTIPADHLQPCRVCNGGQCTISSSDPKSPGVPNADYILYVVAVDAYNCNGQAGASASSCQRESSLDRPIAGLINFCPGEVRKNKIEYMIDVAKHEIIHALGFSKWSLPFYRDQNGRPRTKRDPVTKEPPNVNGQYDLSGVVMSYTHENWAVATGNIKHEVKMLITETVLARARIHFNCPTLPGLELENGGGSGSELSHWEARLLGNELMTGSSANSARLSAITLALLQDTGWYQVDFSKAEPLQWGKNAGCQFLLGSCGGYIKNKLASGGSTEPFCTTITDYSQPLKLGCTPDRDAVGFCNMVKQSSKIPPDYQYFGPQLGGTELKYDYCPFQEVFTYKDGRGTYCNDAKNTPKGTNFLGEFYGPGSSCLYEGIKGWSVTTVPTGKRIERIPNNFGAGCYQVSTTRVANRLTSTSSLMV